MFSKADIIEKLEGIPELKGKIASVNIEGGDVTFMIEITPELAADFEPIRQKAEQQISAMQNVKKVRAILTANKTYDDEIGTKRPPVRENLKPEGIKHIICVASGKGGVGKSTCAASIALALKKQGLKVGLMDADIYGPSIPKLFGLDGFKAQMTDKKLGVAQSQGLSLMSIGFLVDQDTPMIWRGPMVQSAIRQFLQDVEWGTLDILVVDMPPGTGDAQLTMAQKVPLSGAVIVSTPQDLALIDAKKGIEMFKKTDVPILGLIENMSTHICTHCGHEEHIFSHGGVKKEADTQSIEFLGHIPLDLKIRKAADAGNVAPLSVFEEIAKKIKDQLDL